MNNKADNDLVRACQQGDKTAMTALVKSYERPVYNAAFRMLGNRDDAADATQTTFLKAFQNINQFNPSYRFFSWIYRIAMNESINMLKRRPATEALHENTPTCDTGPDHRAAGQQLDAELLTALAKLTDEYRSVIELKYFSDCSYQEMSQILHVPEKTVKSRLYSARKRMKELLELHGVTP